MTKTQTKLVTLMRSGLRLVWHGDSGPELEGHPFWPQKRTVRALLRSGVLKWGEPLNETQRQCGICPVMIGDAK